MNKISWWDRARQFREELDAVADVNWLHPAWQTIVWGSAFLQRSDQATTDAMQTYRSANGGPHSDTFMAWPARQSGPLTHRVARAVVGAIVATQQLGLLQPRLKGQILQACLQWESGWLNPRGLDDRDTANAVFITPQGTFLGRAEPSKAETIGLALYRLLAEGLRPSRRVLQAIDPQDAATVRAAVAVSLFQQSAPGCRHLHRFGWSRGGGPWLGIGETEDLHFVSTCHRAIEGFGHALLTQQILRRVAERAPALGAVLDNQLPDSIPTPLDAVVASPFSQPDLGLATRFLPQGAGRFVHQAYATGRALDTYYRHRGSASAVENRWGRFSPSFHVPVAPVTPAGELQRDSLIRHGLLSVRVAEGRFEPLEDFQIRLHAWLSKERRGHGLLTRLAVANCRARLPRSIKLVLLRSRRRPTSLLPPVEILAGRGRLSNMRFPPAELPSAPLFAVAAPALFPTEKDPRGSQALTLIHHENGCTVTLVGSGHSGTSAGAEEFLDLWLEELAEVRRRDPLAHEVGV